MFSHIEVFCEQVGIRAYDLPKFLQRPDIKLAFNAFAVGVLCGIERTLRR